jgi:hypothetical protein
MAFEMVGKKPDMNFDESWTIETSAGKYMKTEVKAIVAITARVFCCACVYVVTSLVRACVCVSVCVVTAMAGPDSGEPNLGAPVRGRVNK